MTGGLGLGTYRALTAVGGPVIDAYLARRARRGKEDPDRAHERRGIATTARPDGTLVWIHAASVGEAISVLPLIDRLDRDRPDLAVLLTTGTVSSAALMAERLPAGVIHQYVPVDRRPWVARFLDHWHPDLALWVESELWPNLVLETQRRGVPMILLNGRMSEGSFKAWQRLPSLAQAMLAGFALCLGQTEADATRLATLGALRTRSVGNLKLAAPPLPADAEATAALSAALKDRPRWLAASTHPGEEELVAQAHLRLRREHPGLLTVLVPRHATRGAEIAALIATLGIPVARRSAGDSVTAENEVYLADSMGELGLFYRLAGIAFVGGSLVPHGGQNLLEAAKLDCAIMHGPHVANFAEVAADLRSAGATVEVRDAESLAHAVEVLLRDPALRKRRADAAAQVAEARADVLDAVMAEIAPWLERNSDRAAVRAAAKAHARA
ncbi:MAG: 3-deoxy-D-manno-octulosonic acid transferase [Alphaproteobacteria bacterium]|nr:3-deoxy-D-manno-octulosonic acid transferase [Alphaproteobacteria bacterium]